ncbi:MAG: ABC transporter substrate-binding protein [Achromobacter pulmonis]|uniref:Leucine-specific-binding protein n=1 Tax=Achromobacter pulmonis TaxID=1389932 RepID=A0A6S7E3E4_9BURK|nr:ABC transporter substrate-binding protein [Achromobacter pulmonis]MCF7769459.1 ABC transporter substrate-binding protein [Achromobacter pulmonis]MPT26800.1 amino acid ABC transporter substrate-binding protein [Achromobacter sp.]CAB3636489.1 Leucine-specific-binding protein [Achromobacter pulmonis]CAB3894378.1 Leucine-specific-binding protein [Achromobacter pulmonis]
MRYPIILAGIFALAAVPAAQAQETLKLGALVTLSGAGAAWGQGMKNAAEIAADQVNEAGGLDVGGKKYRVQVVAYDDKYQANEAVTVANRLVFEDKVRYVIGPVGSAPVLAIQPMTEKNKVIVMTLGFTTKALAADKPFTFRPNVTTAEVSQPQIDWLVKSLGLRKVGALFPNDETGQQIALDLEGAYKKAGAALSVKEFFERDRVDFVPVLTRMMARGIDAIELDGNSPTTAGLIVKQARELGFEGRIVRTGGPATQEIVNVAGKAATEGMLVHTPIDPELPETKAYAERYAAKYKHAMNGFSPAFYDGTNMLFEAMRRAGTVEDTDRVRVELEKLEGFQGALGKLSWTGKARYGINHQLNAPFYVAEVKDGREVIRARCTVEGCR